MSFVERLSIPSGPVLDLAWTAILYAFPLLVQTTRTWKFHKLSYKNVFYSLRIHVFVALWDTLRYHVRALAGPVVPDVFDVIASLIVTVGVFQVIWSLSKGSPWTMRPMHLTCICLRFAYTMLGFVLGRADLFLAGVKYNNIFAWPRWVIPPLVVLKLSSFADAYTSGMIVGSFLCAADGQLEGAIYIHVATLLGIMLLNRWTANQIKDTDKEDWNPIAAALVYIGFVDLPALQKAYDLEPTETAVAKEIERALLNGNTGKDVDEKPLGISKKE